MSAKIDGAAASLNDFAEPNHGLAVLGEALAGGVGAGAIQHGNHADAAVKRAQHFGFADAAGIARAI